MKALVTGVAGLSSDYWSMAIRYLGLKILMEGVKNNE